MSSETGTLSPFLQFWEPPYYLSSTFLFSLCLPESIPVTCNQGNLSSSKNGLSLTRSPFLRAAAAPPTQPCRGAPPADTFCQPRGPTYTPRILLSLPSSLCTFCSSFLECHPRMFPIYQVRFSLHVTSFGKFSQRPSNWSLMHPEGLVPLK